MNASEGAGGTGDPPTPTEPDALRADIEQTRNAMGDTVDALVSKADVKARAQATFEAQKQALRQKSREGAEKASEVAKAASQKIKETDPNEAAATALAMVRRQWAIAVGVAVSLMLLWGVRRRRSARRRAARERCAAEGI